jgi:hypothetical protein
MITSPSLHGILSDDYLYYEGLRKPQSFFAVRDGVRATIDDAVVLERYWNDMYNLFLRKLTQFAGIEPVGDEESIKLQALLQELIKVKSLIENASKTAIMKK